VWIRMLAGGAGILPAEVITIYDSIDGCLVDKPSFGDYEVLQIFPS
jgi:hypothetical protein